MANVPSYNTNNISIGPGIMYIGPAGATPSIDVGAISEDGIEITVSQEFLEVFQGSPKQLIRQFKTDETMEIVATGIEWDLLKLANALGAGVTTSSASQDTFSFGGDPDTDIVALMIKHTLPSGNTISICVWQAQASGEWSMSMAQDELSTFPYSFKALVSTTNWIGGALSSGSQLFKIIREKQ